MKPFIILIILLCLTTHTFAQNRNKKTVIEPAEYSTGKIRKAVVIGMSNYDAANKLNNTEQDAHDMADAFTKIGFKVTLLTDNDINNLDINLDEWYDTIEGDDMAVFYFAGHGIEFNGENYLVPVDAETSDPNKVKRKTLNVNEVLGNMNDKRVGMKLLILDACRDNPFKNGWNDTRGNSSRGLISMDAPLGTYIAFAASPGNVALDGGSYKLSNGVFTHFLKEEILREGATIERVFTNVTREVSNLTKKKQIPFRSSNLVDEFCFIPAKNNPTANSTPSRKQETKRETKPEPVTNNYSKAEVYSFNDRIEFSIQSCIRDASSKQVILTYSLKNNTGRSYTMASIGQIHKDTQYYCGDFATIIIDDQGNEYTRFGHQLGGQSNRLTMSLGQHISEVVLRPGIMVKGELVITGVDPKARSFQLLNIGFDSRLQENSLGVICRSFGVRNLPIQ